MQIYGLLPPGHNFLMNIMGMSPGLIFLMNRNASFN